MKKLVKLANCFVELRKKAIIFVISENEILRCFSYLVRVRKGKGAFLKVKCYRNFKGLNDEIRKQFMEMVMTHENPATEIIEKLTTEVDIIEVQSESIEITS